MNVKVGSPAPKLELEAYRRGELEPVPFSLDGPRERWLVLFFYPRDFTFVCPTELAAFADLEDAFRAEEADLVAASTDSYWSHKAWFETNAQISGVDFPVVADTSQRLSFDFGVLTEDGSALRGTFIIDPDGDRPAREHQRPERRPQPRRDAPGASGTPHGRPLPRRLEAGRGNALVASRRCAVRDRRVGAAAMTEGPAATSRPAPRRREDHPQV